MSWDLLAQNLPPDIPSLAHLPRDFEPAPLGERSEIIAKLKQAVPFADFSDPLYGRIEDERVSIEVIPDGDRPRTIAFHIRGDSEAGIGLVAAILDHLGFRAIDLQSGEIFAADDTARESFRRWRELREMVARRVITPESEL